MLREFDEYRPVYAIAHTTAHGQPLGFYAPRYGDNKGTVAEPGDAVKFTEVPDGVVKMATLHGFAAAAYAGSDGRLWPLYHAVVGLPRWAMAEAERGARFAWNGEGSPPQREGGSAK